MIGRLTLLLLTLSAGFANAETVQILSGEHADFSRLVVQFEGKPDWTFGRTKEGYLLQASADTKYDVSRIFDRLPRTRIKSVNDAGNGYVAITLNCDCHGDAFEIRQGRVVLDIKNGPPDPKSQFEQPIKQADDESPVLVPKPVGPGVALSPDQAMAQLLHSATNSHETPPPALPMMFKVDPFLPMLPQVGQVQLAPMGDRQDPLIKNGNTTADLKNSAEDKAIPAPFKTATSIQADLDDRMREALVAVQNERLAEAQSDLLKQIGRAAAQGLVQTDLVVPNIVSHTPADMPKTMPTLVSDSKPVEFVPGPNVHVESAVDRDSEKPEHSFEMNSQGDTCLADEEIDVASWGEPTPNGVTAGQLMTGLVGEFDRPDPDAIAILAKRLIYMGFGAEVKLNLAAFGVQVPQAWILRALADVMDDEPSQERKALALQYSCKSAVALWGVLSANRLANVRNVDRGAVLRAFSGLPTHLRSLLGPKLAKIFLDVKDQETAVSIRNIVARASDPTGSALDMMEAQIAMASGKYGQAEELLDRVVAEGGPESTMAVSDLIDMRTSQGQEVSAQTAALAGALAFENRGTELGAGLAITAIRGLIASGDFSTALKTIATASTNSDLAPDQVQPLRAAAIQAAADNSSDADFLLLVKKFPFLPTEVGETTQEARRAVATRLVDTGFSKWARSVLDVGANLTGSEEKMLLARIAILEQRPVDAQSYLVGMQGPNPDILRARAFELQNNFQAAALLYAKHDLDEDRRAAAWQAEGWSDIETVGKPEQVKAAGLMLATLENPLPMPDDNIEVSQKSAKVLLDRAAEVQAVVADLIGR